MKQITFLKSFFLLCALMVGSVSGWAIDAKVTITRSSFGNVTGGYASYDWTADGVSGKGQIYATTTSYIQMNGGNDNGKVIYNTSAIPGKIKSVKITRYSSGNNRSYTVYVSATAYSGSGTSYGTSLGSKSVTTSGVTWSVSSGDYSYLVILNNTSNACNIAEIEITYEKTSTATITPLSNNETYGTVSLNGTTITATPKSGYQVSKTTPYTINTGTATVTQNGNEFEVDASSDCTITINFEEIPIYTVILFDDTENPLIESVGGGGVTLPSRSNVGGDTFVGWSETDITVDTKTSPTVIPAGTYHPEGDITLYPLYSHSSPGIITKYKQISSLSDVEEGVYVIGSIYQTDGSPLVYMPNTTSSSSNPTLLEGLTTETASGITYLTNTITDDMLWDFTSTGTANQYYFRPHGSTTIGLGCTTSTGDKIRISSSYKDMKWTVAVSTDYNWQFKNDATTAMYLAVYNKYAWRNYDSSTTNQKGKFYIYKSIDEDGMVTYYTCHPITSVPATITAAEYATYCNATRSLDFSTTGITVYTATDNETSVTLNEIASGQVPANTPVVLYKAGADGTAINVPVIASASAISGTNDLHVVGEGGLTGVDNIFVLSKKNNKVGFRLWDKTQTLNAGKIYLQGQDSYGARDFLAFDGTTTGIANVEANDNLDANAPMYNLAGQRVNKSYKGVVIVNGKKMLNK